MATWIIDPAESAPGWDFGDIAAAYASGSVSSGDDFELVDAAHDAGGTTSISSSKNITINAQSGAEVDGVSYTAGARIIWDGGGHIWGSGHSGDITANDIGVRSDNGTDSSVEVIRTGNNITCTWTRCMIWCEDDSGGEGAYSQVDNDSTHIFRNCLIRGFDRTLANGGAIMQGNYATVTLTMEHCTVDIPGGIQEGQSRSHTINIKGCNFKAGTTTDGMGSATYNYVDNCCTFAKPANVDTDSGNTFSTSFTATTTATGVIIEVLPSTYPDGDYTLKEATGGGDNVAEDAVDPAVITSGTDIAGTTMPSAPADSGCFQFAASGGTTIDCGTDSLSLTTFAASVAYDVTVTAAAPTSLSLATASATVAYDVTVSSGTAALSLATSAATVSFNVIVNQGAPASLSLTTYQATVDVGGDTEINCGTASLSLAIINQTVKFDTIVNCAPVDGLLMAAYTADVNLNVTINCGVASLALAADSPATVTFDTIVACSAASLSLATHNAQVLTTGAQNIYPGRVEHTNTINPPAVWQTFEMRHDNVNLLEGSTVIYSDGTGFADPTLILLESVNFFTDYTIRLGTRIRASRPSEYEFFAEVCYGHISNNNGVIQRRKIEMDVMHNGGTVKIQLDNPGSSTDTCLSGQAIPTTVLRWNYVTENIVEHQNYVSTAWKQNNFIKDYIRGSGQADGPGMTFRADIILDNLTRSEMYRLSGMGGAWSETDGRRVWCEDDWFSYTHPFLDNRYTGGPKWTGWINGNDTARASHGYDHDCFGPPSHMTFGWGSLCEAVIQGGEEYQTDFGYVWLVMQRAATWLANTPDPTGRYSGSYAVQFPKTGRAAGRQVQMGALLWWALGKIVPYATGTRAQEIHGLRLLVATRLSQVLQQQYDAWQSNGPGGLWAMGARLNTIDLRQLRGIGATGITATYRDPQNRGGVFYQVAAIAWWEAGHWFNGLQIYQEARLAEGIGEDAAIHALQKKIAEEIYSGFKDWSAGHPWASAWTHMGSTRYNADPRDTLYYQRYYGSPRWAIPYVEIHLGTHPTFGSLNTINEGHSKFCIPAIQWLKNKGYKVGDTKTEQILSDYDDIGHWWQLGAGVSPGRVESTNVVKPATVSHTNDQSLSPNRVEPTSSVAAVSRVAGDDQYLVLEPVESTSVVQPVGEVQIPGGAQATSPGKVLSTSVVKAATVMLETAAVTPGAVVHANDVKAATVAATYDIEPGRVESTNLVRGAAISPIEISPGRVESTSEVRAVRKVGGLYRAYVLYSGDGSATTFSFLWPYLDPSHIRVYVDGDELVYEDDYTVSGGSVTLATAPGSGVSVSVLRRTTHARPWVTFPDHGHVRKLEWEAALRQIIYYSEEVADLRTGYTP